MEKVTRLPSFFGIDGYALPEEFRKYKDPEHKEPEEDFGALLDAAIERRKKDE